MKVLLAVPYQSTLPYVVPSLGLGYLAGALRAAGHEVGVLDCVLDHVGRAGWRSALRRGGYDVVGVQIFTYNFPNAREMLEVAREVLPQAVTVAGGPHLNADGVRTLEHVPALDFGVSGEGERAVVELCAALEAGREAGWEAIPNLVWRDGAAVRGNPRFYEPDLDALAPVAWDLIPPRRYPLLGHGILNRAHPVAPIQTSRGCPFPCAFCSAQSNMGARVRTRSPEAVVDEIARLVLDHGVREIHIEDDNFTFHRESAAEVCRLLVARRLDVVWACPNGVRLDSLDAELLRLMERAGCYSFGVGIESGSDSVLRAMRKQLTTAEILERLHLIRATTDIRTTGFFVLGFPGETRADLAATERFILRAPLDRIGVSPFVPTPESPAYRDLAKRGLVPIEPEWVQQGWGYADGGYVAYGEVPREELVRRMKRVSLRFYLRPRVLAGVLGEIHSPAQVRVAAKYALYLTGLRKSRYW